MQTSFLRKTALALLAAAASNFAFLATARADERITDEGDLLTSITAKVESIDAGKRQITLRGPLDNVITLSAGKDVKRFDEIKAGDYVTADYYISLALDLSMPDPDDMDHPVSIADVTERAPAGAPPGAAEFNTIRVVATVEGMDAPTKTLALRGPAGRHFLVAVKTVDDLKALRIDDKVSVLCTQAVVVSLDKASPSDAEKVKRSAQNTTKSKTREAGKSAPAPSTPAAPKSEPSSAPPYPPEQ